MKKAGKNKGRKLKEMKEKEVKNGRKVRDVYGEKVKEERMRETCGECK